MATKSERPNVMYATIEVDGKSCRVIAAHLKMGQQYGVVVHNDNPSSDKGEFGAAIYDAESGESRKWTFHDTAAEASIVAQATVVKELSGGLPAALEEKGIRVRDGEVHTDCE